MTDDSKGPVRRWLERSSQTTFVVYAIAVSFTTYFCMYAFRKPFAAGLFEGEGFQLPFTDQELRLKTGFVLSQLLGYLISKYVGIKICSEVTRRQRAFAIVAFIALAWFSLLLFAIAPGPGWRAAALLLNGLPLGMIWGLVVWYLEGRRTAELLLAGLSCSFIMASGVVKGIGRDLIESGAVTEYWMPFATGAIFVLPMLVAVWLLNQIPDPDEADKAARHDRAPMNAEQRNSFLRTYLPGLVLLFAAYIALTGYRDFRDNYQVDIYRQALMQYEGVAEADAAAGTAEIGSSETLVAVGVIACLALLFRIRSNATGLAVAFVLMVVGVVLLGGSTLLLRNGQISVFWWMVLTGFGSYLAYVPYGSVLFERIMAHTRAVGTAVFGIYVADALGYTGSFGLQIYKDLGQPQLDYLGFFERFSLILSVGGVLLLVASAVYFLRRPPQEDPQALPATGAEATV